MINLYIDLDDTLFQTKYKNPNAKIQATYSAAGKIDSFMTVAQQCWLDVWLDRKDVRLIPITARSLTQYQRTHLSQNPRITLAVIYFSGQILNKGLPDLQWQQRWQHNMQQLSLSVTDLYKQMSIILQKYSSQAFRLYDVDGFYVTVKAHRDCPVFEREQCFKALTALQPEAYTRHQNARAFSWLPEFLNKKYAVEYLQKNYSADLHIGMGDSHSDWDFMQLCDFQIMPKKAQLQQLFNERITALDLQEKKL